MRDCLFIIWWLFVFYGYWFSLVLTVFGPFDRFKSIFSSFDHCFCSVCFLLFFSFRWPCVPQEKKYTNNRTLDIQNENKLIFTIYVFDYVSDKGCIYCKIFSIVITKRFLFDLTSKVTSYSALLTSLLLWRHFLNIFLRVYSNLHVEGNLRTNVPEMTSEQWWVLYRNCRRVRYYVVRLNRRLTT